MEKVYIIGYGLTIKLKPIKRDNNTSQIAFIDLNAASTHSDTVAGTIASLKK